MPRPVTIDQVRSAYLEFFQNKDHLVVPSSSLVPIGDPTLLFTSAGMVQFKPYFTGEETPPNRRLASVQKCFRTSDIDSVGDTKHLTFFEMLGNFSIGDYFKKETVRWAWEFVTDVLELPRERLWVTVHLDDDEAEDIWLDIGVPKERVLRYGDKENFWGPAGEEGPCGPSSEIHYDYGEEYGAHLTPEDGGDRFVELWNLVFTQYYHHRDGSRTPLPRPNIDTGMGLERTAAVMQEVLSTYETEAFSYLVSAVAGLAGRSYGDDEDADYAIRVCAEHARAATFLVADGVVPSNEGRGYVLRRILRRGVRYARKAGIEGPFLVRLAELAVERMGQTYPGLERERDFVATVLSGEEERFTRTLDAGMEILDGLVARHKDSGESTVTGSDSFRLYDTFGFPVDITQDIARERGMEVDLAGFEREMEVQRERGRAAARFGLGDGTSPDTYRQLGLEGARFTGYEALAEDTVIIGILCGGAPTERAAKGDSVEVVLRETPFYAEGGGQVGDRGAIRGPSGTVHVTDTQSPVPGITAHVGEIVEGEIAVGEPVVASVDPSRRADVVRNHTATHLVHAALRRVLGTHVRQAGSLVAPDRLRFDFSHPSPVGQADLHEIESLVNEKVLENLQVAHQVMPYDEAMAQGALAFFGDKYGEVVRICRIGNGETFSLELCGGTHANATGEIGLVHIEGEGSIGAGTRRVEALTGRGTESALRDRHVLMETLAKQLQTSPAELGVRVETLLADLDRERKRASVMERDLARSAAEALTGRVESVDGVPVVAAQVPVSSVDALREVGDWLKERLQSAVIVLGAAVDDRPSFIAMVTPDLVSRGYDAGNLVRDVAKVTGGGGGGRPGSAQAGGKERSKLGEALALVPELVRRR